MNIAYDLRPLQSASAGRGIGVYTRRLVETFSLIDRDNHYLLFHYAGKKKPVLNLAEGFSHQYHPLPSLPQKLSRLNFFRDLLFLEGELKKLNPDAIHFTSPMELDSHYDVHRLNPSSVVTFHDMIPYIFRNSVFTGRRKLLFPLYKSLLWTLEKTGYIIFVSEHSRQDILNLLKISPEKTTVIHSGFGDGGDSDKNREIIAQVSSANLPCGLNPREYAIFVGDASPYKNPDIVVKALPEIKKKTGIDVHFAIAGKVNPPDRERLEKIADKEGCSPFLHFTGFLSNEDLNRLYGNARCVVYPSRYEGFGFPGLEAMNAGVPLIAADATAIPEVVGEGGILLPPDDVNLWAEEMGRIFTDNNHCEELIEKGKLRLQNFSWDKTARATLEIYGKIKNR